MVVLLLMANYAGYRSKIHLSLLFKIPEPLLYSIDGAALAEGLSQASLLSMSAAFVVMLALSLVGVFTKVRWSPRWD